MNEREQFYLAFPKHAGVLEMDEAGSISAMDSITARHQFAVWMACAESKQAEIDALKQELQELREQKPVAWMYKDSCGKYSTPMLELRPDVPGYHECWKPEPLFAAPVPASEGWKLVPIESTEEMQLAGMAELPLDSVIYTEAVYKAMLAAAPKEPE